jgi:hypothetical protein
MGKGRRDCPGASSSYGRVVRVPLSPDRRNFTPLARSGCAWEKVGDLRMAVERVNSRLDQVLGFERRTIRGMAKMRVRVGPALLVMLSMALGRIRSGWPERMRCHEPGHESRPESGCESQAAPGSVSQGVNPTRQAATRVQESPFGRVRGPARTAPETRGRVAHPNPILGGSYDPTHDMRSLVAFGPAAKLIA